MKQDQDVRLMEQIQRVRGSVYVCRGADEGCGVCRGADEGVGGADEGVWGADEGVWGV